MTPVLKKLVFGLILLVVAIVVVFAIWKLLPHSNSPFTKTIQKQTSFIIFYPDDQATDFNVDPATVKYSTAYKVVSFSARSTSNKIVIAEQITPDQFNDIPQYWQAFTDKLNAYKTFDSANGKVALTRPAELKGGQSAVFNGKGTLMFLRPDHDLSEDAWRKLFNTLKQ